MKTTLITTILALFFTSNSFAEDSKPRRVKLGGEHQVITSAAKLTGGIVSTMAGAAHFVAFPVSDLIRYGKIKPLKLQLSKRGEHIQLRFKRPNPIGISMGYSWGTFQINPYDPIEDHELGHSTATDTMGPIILAYGLYDYLKNGHSIYRVPTSTLERWADAESLKDPTAVRRFKLGVFTGVNAPLGVAFSVTDEADYVMNPRNWAGRSMHQQKRFEFAKTRLNLGIVDDCDCELPVSGNVDGMTYLTRMTLGDGQVRPVFEGLYRLGSIAVNPKGDAKADVVTSENNAGVKIYITDQFQAYLNAGIASRVTMAKQQGQDLIFDVLVGVTARGGLIFGNIARVEASVEEYAGVQSGISRRSLTFGRTISESKRSSVQVGVEAVQETITPDEGQSSFDLNHLRLYVGGEF